MLIWRIAAEFLLTKDNLARVFEIRDALCPLCKLEIESLIHLFVLCLVAKAIWFNSQQGVMTEALWFSSALELIQLFSSPPFVDCLSLDQKANDFMLFGAILYDGI